MRENKFVKVKIDYDETFKYYTKPIDEYEKMSIISDGYMTINMLMFRFNIIKNPQDNIIDELYKKIKEAEKYLIDYYNYNKYDFRAVWRFETAKELTQQETRNHIINVILK